MNRPTWTRPTWTRPTWTRRAEPMPTPHHPCPAVPTGRLTATDTDTSVGLRILPRVAAGLVAARLVAARLVATGLVAACTAGLALAHDQVPGPPQRRPVLVRDATVHRIDGKPLERASVLFDRGQITAVGVDAEVPDDTEVVDGTGKHLYPGLFESYTDLGLREINAVDVTVDTTEFGDRNPNARSWVAINPDSELIPVTRAGGVLLAHVSPAGRFLRGQTSVVQLDGWTVEEMALRAPATLAIAWESIQPSDRDESSLAKRREEKFRELDTLFEQVRRYRNAREREAAGQPSDVRLESLIPVLDGHLPLFAQAEERSAIEAAVAYAHSRGMRLIIVGGYDAAECAELLAGHDVPVIVASVHRLPRRRHDPYDAPFTLPMRLQRAGVRFAIAGEGTGGPGGAANARNLPYHAATAVAYGLSHEDALRAITLSPAEILGVADRVGSITVGKDATLILADGDILQTESHVTDAWIQGRRVDLRSKHTRLFEKYREKYRQSAVTASDRRRK